MFNHDPRKEQRRALNSRDLKSPDELVRYKAAGKKWITKKRSEFKNAHGPCFGRYSYDGDMWKEIVAKFSAAHQISERDFIKIVAFCFPEWGGRRAKKNGTFEYWVQENDILDARMGWGRFKREIDRAIRLTKTKLGGIDRLWDLRKKYTTAQPPGPLVQESRYTDILDEMPDDPTDEEEREMRRTYNNLAYGIWDDKE